MKVRVSAFWQAVTVVICSWLIFKWAFPPFLPMSLMITYIIITIIGVARYFSSDDLRLAELAALVIAMFRN